MNLDQDKVPSNLEECLDILKEGLNKEELDFIKNMYPPSLHFSLGMYMRNQWSLWETDTILVRYFHDNYGVDHADDISGIIIACLIDDLNERPRKDHELANRFINHWK